MPELPESAKCCAQLLAEGLDHPEGNDAHHRGQSCAVARQLGHPLPKQGRKSGAANPGRSRLSGG
jgi:uncharacterized damage-inducible protein DinB